MSATFVVEGALIANVVPILYLRTESRRSLQAAVNADADMVTTPCPLCQQNVEMYQGAINKKFGTDFNIPVMFYSQLMAVAFGMEANRDAALNHNMIPSEKLEKWQKAAWKKLKSN